MRNHLYILEGQTPVPAKDILSWGRWMEGNKDVRRVAHDEIGTGVSVSTVFLGLDHQFDNCEPPLLFETMVFGGQHDQMQQRYSTWAEALKGHREIVAQLK